MSQTFKSNGVSLGQAAVRLGQEPGWTEMADNGAVGTSTIIIDNPAGSVTVAAWKTFSVDEGLISGNTRTYTGTAVKRVFRRGTGPRTSIRTGAGNEIEVDVNDLNERLARHIITGTDGVRPAETVSARITWILASTYLSGLVANNGFVAASTVALDANDYTGQNTSSVIADCALAAHFNHFVYADPATNVPSLWFDDSNTSTNYDSGMAISNVLTDINQAAVDAGTASVFWAHPDWSAEYDPTRAYSGVYLPYAKGHVYLTNSTISSNFTARDGSAPNANVQSDAAATVVANNFLTDNATEDIRINCTIQVAAKQANAIRAGQLVQYKNTALPDYVTYKPFRVLQRSLSQPDETDQYYAMPLVLSPATHVAAFVQHVIGQTDVAIGVTVDFASPVTAGNLLVIAMARRNQGNLSNMETYLNAINRDNPVGPARSFTPFGAPTSSIIRAGDIAGPDGAVVGYRIATGDEQHLYVSNTRLQFTIWEISGADYTGAQVVALSSQAASVGKSLGSFGTPTNIQCSIFLLDTGSSGTQTNGTGWTVTQQTVNSAGHPASYQMQATTNPVIQVSGASVEWGAMAVSLPNA